MTTPQAEGRSGSKQDTLLREIRRQIVNGTLAPGIRLPTRLELEQKHRVSWLTIQQALNRLARDGFVAARGRNGTFVVDHPPHLNHYAVVLSSDEAIIDKRWGFQSTLAQQAREFASANPTKRVSLYYGIEGHVDVEDYQRLLRDIRAQRVAGLILLTPPWTLENSELMTEPNLPRVAVASPIAPQPIPCVFPDLKNFIDRAVERLAQQGRKRLALIGVGSHGHNIGVERFESACARNHVETRRPWMQFAAATPWGDRVPARHTAELLMSLPPENRPDGLVITDDHVIDGVTLGLVASGVSIPRDLGIVAHANFPRPQRGAVPADYLGFDNAAIMRACVQSIDVQRRGAEASNVTMIPSIFESEFVATRPATGIA